MHYNSRACLPDRMVPALDRRTDRCLAELLKVFDGAPISSATRHRRLLRGAHCLYRGGTPPPIVQNVFVIFRGSGYQQVAVYGFVGISHYLPGLAALKPSVLLVL